MYNEIDSLLDSSLAWKPDAIWWPNNCETARLMDDVEYDNLMDFIGDESNNLVYKLEKCAIWGDYSSKDAWQALIIDLINSCATSGFQIACKGWEKKRMAICFFCA